MRCQDCHKNKVEYMVYFDWTPEFDNRGSYGVCFLCALDKKFNAPFKEVYSYKELNFWQRLFWRIL